MAVLIACVPPKCRLHWPEQRFLLYRGDWWCLGWGWGFGGAWAVS